jgi:hypothetical protein
MGKDYNGDKHGDDRGQEEEREYIVQQLPDVVQSTQTYFTKHNITQRGPGAAKAELRTQGAIGSRKGC